MPDRQRVPSDEDLFDEKPQNLLPFGYLERIRVGRQSGSEVSQRLHQTQVFGLVRGRSLQRLQFALDRVLLLAQFRHTAAELFQTHQSFLVGGQQPVHACRQPGTVSPQLLLALPHRVPVPVRPAITTIDSPMRDSWAIDTP